jgi:DNA-binding response OmpR family regulator
MVTQKPGVLIVDDDAAVCDLPCEELGEGGYRCGTAGDGGEALTKLATGDFEVVLLDIRLPVMSGMEVLRKVSASSTQIATVMLTAVNDVDLAVEALKLGAWDYIVKPFALDRLRTSVQSALEEKERRLASKSCDLPYCVERDGQTEPFRQIHAIARGVEARYESLLGYSRMVAQETTALARQLGIPDQVIKQWADTRARREVERANAINMAVHKLERSPLAQSVMGVAVPHPYSAEMKNSQN